MLAVEKLELGCVTVASVHVAVSILRQPGSKDLSTGIAILVALPTVPSREIPSGFALAASATCYVLLRNLPALSLAPSSLECN